MKAIVIVAIVACSLLLTGCVFVKIKDDGTTKSGVKVSGNGIIGERDYPVASFSAIKLSVPADVTYETAETCALSVKVDENLFDYLTVDVEDGVLKIGSTTSSFRHFKKLAIRVSSPALERLTCDGAVDFEAKGAVRGDDFTMVVNGAADVDIASLDVRKAEFEINGAGDIDIHLVDADQVALNISGAGDAKLSGKAREARVAVHGAGDVDLTRLEYETLDKQVHGVGSVKTGKSR